MFSFPFLWRAMLTGRSEHKPSKLTKKNTHTHPWTHRTITTQGQDCRRVGATDSARRRHTGRLVEEQPAEKKPPGPGAGRSLSLSTSSSFSCIFTVTFWGMLCLCGQKGELGWPFAVAGDSMHHMLGCCPCRCWWWILCCSHFVSSRRCTFGEVSSFNSLLVCYFSNYRKLFQPAY